MAIAAGLIASTLVDTYQLGPVAPFDAAATVLVIGGILIAFLWQENYGNPKQQTSLTQQFKAATAEILGGKSAPPCTQPKHLAQAHIRSDADTQSERMLSNVAAPTLMCPVSVTVVCYMAADTRVALLGGMQSLFEAAMYSFVFLWTPALSPNGEKIPHGTIFSCFMTSSMVSLLPVCV